jgi:predicted O-methyltransferase YrrM
MLRDTVKRLAVRAGRRWPGKHVVHAAAADDRAPLRFGEVEVWPGRIAGFEDLAFLFRSSQLDHGIASLRFDEAALLFRTVRSLGRATIAELGRYKGGSTFVMASAMEPGSQLWSYDLHLHGPDGPRGEDLDRELAGALARFGIDGVQLLVADTRTAAQPPQPCDLVFVDGDHSYEGARADFERWRNAIRPGGHLLFHDAVDTAGWGTVHAGVVQLVAEIEREADFAAADGAGTIAHFVRRVATIPSASDPVTSRGGAA